MIMTLPSAQADITPAGAVTIAGGDPGNDGPLPPTVGDLILETEDSVLVDTGAVLLVDGGSLLQAGNLLNPVGSNGDITVTGPGSRVALLSDVATRAIVDGTLSILDGGVVDASGSNGACGLATCGVSIGQNGGASGSLLVSGVGSVLNTTEAFTVGTVNGGDLAVNALGTVLVASGGVINADRIGFSQGTAAGSTAISQAFVTVDGPGSQINGSRIAILGNAFGNGAEATLTIENQGAFNVTDAIALAISDNTTATLNIATGGTLTGVNLQAALVAGATATVNLGGAGSTMTLEDEVIIGQGGVGALNVSNDAAIAIGGGAPGGFLGSGLTVGTVGGTGSLLVDSATIDMIPNSDSMDTRFNIGLFGTGDAAIQNGAVVSILDSSGQPGLFGDGVTVGQSQGLQAGIGTLVVQGAGTQLNVDSTDVAYLIAGLTLDGVAASSGTVDILDGAVVNILGQVGASGVTLGRGENSTGVLNLSGPGSTLNIVGETAALLVAGNLGTSVGDGSGQLTVTDQATIAIRGTTPGQGFLNVGLGTGDGDVLVDDGGSITVDGDLNISLQTAQNNSQSGQVTIGDAGTISVANGFVGDRGVLDGGGSLVADSLTVIGGGTLALANVDSVGSTLIDGGEFDVGAQDLLFGRAAGQTLSVQNAASVAVGGDAVFGNSRADTRVTVSDQGSVFNVGGTVTMLDSLALNSGAQLSAVGPVSVNAGGLLGGDGGTLRTPSVFINAGGRIAPGNSPGTLNVVGDVTLAGGQWDIEIAGDQPGEFDVLNVDGDLDLTSGSISVSLLNGYNPGGQAFDVTNVTGDLALDPDVALLNNGPGPDFEFLIRSEGGVNIGSVNFTAINLATVPGLSSRQLAFADYLDDVCPNVESLGNPDGVDLDLDLRCGNLRSGANSANAVAVALDAISPDEIVASFGSLFRFTGIQHGNLSRRLNGLRNGATRVDVRGLNIETEDVSISGEDLQNAIAELTDDKLDRWGFFSDGRIAFGDRDPSSRVAGFDFDTVSLTLGTDYRLSKSMYLGAAVGFSGVNADFDAGGGVLAKTYSLSLLGTYFREDSFYVDGLISYGLSDVGTSRRVRYQDAGGLVSRKADGDTDGHQFSAGLGTGWDLHSGRWVYGIHAGTNYSNVLIDEFDERGALGLNMSIPDIRSKSFTANLGLHASWTSTPRWGVLVPYARLDRVHEFENDTEFENVRFVRDRFQAASNNPTQAVAVSNGGADSNYWIWSVGAHAQFIRGMAAFVDYRATAGLEDLDVSEVTVGFRYEASF